MSQATLTEGEQHQPREKMREEKGGREKINPKFKWVIFPPA